MTPAAPPISPGAPTPVQPSLPSALLKLHIAPVQEFTAQAGSTEELLIRIQHAALINRFLEA